jgi:thiol-disulfide isomerase/thioredoxin
MKKLFIIIFLITTIFGYSIGPKTFYRAIKKKDIVIVKFWATWCVPCSVLNTEFRKAKRKLGRKVLFTEYNVDLGGRPLKEYKIEYIPTMVIFKNGIEVSRSTNILGSDEIVNWIKRYK